MGFKKYGSFGVDGTPRIDIDKEAFRADTNSSESFFIYIYPGLCVVRTKDTIFLKLFEIGGCELYRSVI